MADDEAVAFRLKEPPSGGANFYLSAVAYPLREEVAMLLFVTDGGFGGILCWMA